jgi:hypothetical protein
LKLHIRGALTNGLTKDADPRDLHPHVDLCGRAGGVDAFRQAREVFAEQARSNANDIEDTIMDIGFIGLGNMGYPMARRLVEAATSSSSTTPSGR